MSTSSATESYCRAHCGRPSDGRLVEDERSGSAPASRTVAFLREWEIRRGYKGKDTEGLDKRLLDVVREFSDRYLQFL